MDFCDIQRAHVHRHVAWRPYPPAFPWSKPDAGGGELGYLGLAHPGALLGTAGKGTGRCCCPCLDDFGLLKGNLGSRGWILISGALMGVSILVQPSMQLLPAFIAVGAFVNGVDINKFIKNGFLFLLAMGFMITPWTIRNLNVFGEPLLVSSNGGDVLYRANNELATGVYIEKGQIDLRDMPELDRGREGQRLAKEWALAHPQDFVQLSASKIMHFMGDDAYGVYAVFKRGGVGLERNAYLFVRQVSAMPWLIIWVCMSIWLVGRRSGKGIGLDPGQALVMAPILYLSIIHSIFESGPKYHMPLVPLVLVVAATLAAYNQTSRS